VWRWSGDGRSLFVGVRSQLPLKLEKLDLATGRREPWLSLAPPDVAGVFSIADVHLSSDGRAYAYTYSRNLGDLYLVEGLR
jgi:hypothetical protein